ncbi:MAG: hypothetical protein V1492_02565 [Candidatus Micrarchaeota archaeon]
MLLEMEPAAFNKALLSCGLSEAEVREIGIELSKNNLTLADEALLEKLIQFGKDMFTIIAVFNKLGIGKDTVITLIERRQKQRVGKSADIYSIEVEGL